MCHTEANKHIFVSLIICSIDDNLNKKKQVSWYTNPKNFFSEKKLQLIKNLRIKSLNFFSHHINIIVVICPMEVSCTSNQSYE